MDRERREKIHEILISKPFTSLQELTELFPNVSSMTIRRDIEYFEEKGDVIKVRGGARALHFITLTLEESYYKRATSNQAGKEKIAMAALSYIESGRSLYFDSGSTVAQLVPHLPAEKLNILTSDPNIALGLSKNPQVSVNMTGGSLNKSNLSLSGQEAIQVIEKTNIDVAFIAPSGFSLDGGFTCGNYNEGLLKRAVVSKARTVVCLVHSAKFDKSMPNTFAMLTDVDVIITDKDPSKNVKTACKTNHVKLIVTE